MDNQNPKSGGIGFCGLLTIVFIILKLCNVIAWSWLWVLAPIWVPLVIAFIGSVIIFGICVVSSYRKK